MLATSSLRFGRLAPPGGSDLLRAVKAARDAGALPAGVGSLCFPGFCGGLASLGLSIQISGRTGGGSPMRAELERFADRAAADGLLDVAYTTVDSPFGPLLVAKTRRGLAKVSFPTIYDSEETLEELAARISPRVLEAPAELDDVRRQLDRYFEGKLREFDLPLDWRLTSGFR